MQLPRVWRQRVSEMLLRADIAQRMRAGLDLKLDAFDRLGREIPVLADIRPTGRFLMEDFYYAGGTRALLNRLDA